MTAEQITDGELAIMEVVWGQRAPTSRDIAEVIYDSVTDSKLASVQKMLERLEAKHFVKRNRKERAHRFQAIVSREAYLQTRLKELADRLYDGSLTPLITTLVRSKEFSKKNFDQLRNLIDELWPDQK